MTFSTEAARGNRAGAFLFAAGLQPQGLTHPLSPAARPLTSESSACQNPQSKSGQSFSQENGELRNARKLQEVPQAEEKRYGRQAETGRVD